MDARILTAVGLRLSPLSTRRIPAVGIILARTPCPATSRPLLTPLQAPSQLSSSMYVLRTKYSYEAHAGGRRGQKGPVLVLTTRCAVRGAPVSNITTCLQCRNLRGLLGTSIGRPCVDPRQHGTERGDKLDRSSKGGGGGGTRTYIFEKALRPPAGDDLLDYFTLPP